MYTRLMAEASAVSFDRMIRAVEKVRERLLKVTRALDEAGIPYAVVGGNAVAAWVSTVDESAVRNTRNVDVLLRRGDLERTKAVLEAVGFVYRHVAGLDVFLDGPAASARDAVHVVFAGETVREGEPAANPDVSATDRAPGWNLVTLDALVQIKLTAFRDKDRTHLRDLVDVGLVDRSWLDKLEPALSDRLRSILDDPLG